MKKSQYGTDLVLEEVPLGEGSFILSVYDQVFWLQTLSALRNVGESSKHWKWWVSVARGFSVDSYVRRKCASLGVRSPDCHS